MCRWTLQDHWAPLEHSRDTGHAFSASCCRLPIRPVDRLQTLSLACICVTQFADIVLAAGLTSDNEETDKIMAALVVFLNILVIVLMPLSLLMTAPGLFKAIGKAQREGQQVLERMSKLPP